MEYMVGVVLALSISGLATVVVSTVIALSIQH